MNERLNAICPYFAMFPLEYPKEIIQNNEITSVLDPFCGRGTTNLAARSAGVFSVGIDSSKVAYAIASSKMVKTTPDSIVSECIAILSSNIPADVPEGEFWSMMYRPEVLKDICRIREALLDDCSSPERIALRGIMLGALHGPLRVNGSSSYLSNQFPRTYASKPNYSVRYWKSKGYLEPPYVSVLKTVEGRARRYYTGIDESPTGFIVNGDSTESSTFDSIRERIEERRFDAVITSPPYLKMYTYIPDQWIRHWFVGGLPSVEYSLDGQIHDGVSEFEKQLETVWNNCADICDDGAHLYIRFGKIGSDNNDPVAIITKSLENTDWSNIVFSEAGVPVKGRRQSDSFLNTNPNGYREIDVCATLN